MRGAPDAVMLVMVLLLSMVPVVHAQPADPNRPAPKPEAEAEKPNAAAAAAQPGSLFQSLSLGSSKGPVRIDADSLELDYKTSNITYRGHVQVTQGDVTLNSDRLLITYDPAAVKRDNTGSAGTPKRGGTDADRIKQIIAEGNVRIRQGTRLAEGRRAVFDQAKQTFTLSDGAVLHEGPNQVAGERVIVYLKEERSVVESGSNTRVKAVLYPGKDDREAKATALPIQAAEPAATAQP
jgi:lipopolysaccharide export system protein LptA